MLRQMKALEDEDADRAFEEQNMPNAPSIPGHSNMVWSMGLLQIVLMMAGNSSCRMFWMTSIERVSPSK